MTEPNQVSGEHIEKMSLGTRIAHIALRTFLFAARPIVFLVILLFLIAFGAIGIAYFYFFIATLFIALPVLVHFIETREAAKSKK